MYRNCFLATGLVFSTFTYAAASDLSEFLHQVFDKHVGRAPSGMEMNYQANLMRDRGPLESYISLFGSDDYFVNRAQRNDEVYVRNLYRTFLLREARPDEVRYWVNRFAQPGANRRGTLRSFLRSYHVTQLPSFPAECRPTPYRVPASTAEIASELIAQVELFIQTYRHEVGGARYGRTVLDQASRLLTVSSQYQDALRSRSTTTQQLRIASENLEQALQGLEAEFCRVPGASPMSRQILGRISRLVTAARLAYRETSNPGSGNGWPSGNRGNLYRDVEALREQVQSYAYGLQYYGSNPDYDRLARDVQSFLVQIDALSLMVRQNQSISRLRRTVGIALTQADAIAGNIDAVDLNIQRGWWTIQRGLDRVAEAVGVSHAWNNVSRPVLLGHPAWQQFGSQPQPAVGIPTRNRNVVDLADQLLVQIDGALRSLTPLARRNMDVARLRASMMDLQNAVHVLRQAAASGSYGSQLTAASERTVEQYQETSKLFAAVVGQDPTLNTPKFYQIGELIQRLQYTASGVPQ
jgi:hypothetical protein